MVKRLLITAAGTGTGFGYALALAQTRRDVGLITADTNAAEWVSASVFAERHVQVRPFHEDGYLRMLNSIIEAHGVTHYLPILDPEICCASQQRDSLAAHLLAPPAAFVDFAIGKQAYAEVLPQWGLKTPRNYERARPILPCYAKRPGTFGSRAAWIVRSDADLASLPDDAFLQELIPGPEFTVDCFPLDPSRAPFCSVRERVEVKAGVCTKAHIARNMELEHVADRLVKAFGLQYPFCFQAIQRDGYWVTDINPRLGAGTAMSAANGSDFFGAHLAQVFGGSPHALLRRHHESCVVTRQYVEYVSAA